jgi:hypothetical protein
MDDNNPATGSPEAPEEEQTLDQLLRADPVFKDIL